eukprot:CAMPEP_0196580726 /NCGR_PEP_ID=MMETSP1081-20130531/30284_1 /TAXON_ID=36882 /ORGANISM="Pyramimonas amylifera, Strain CCMP720" /LENGTH=426 /DNA_ID=CAMNT_0041900683 /DNA_START=122 /DNA_END=1402 /DNA_ORIENTATION=+
MSSNSRVNTIARHINPTSGTMSISLWSGVPQAPPDPILGITEAFKADPATAAKLNLGVGAYRTEDGKPLVLKVVRRVEQAIVSDMSRNKEYLPMGGNAEFCKLSRALILGNDSRAIAEKRVATVQALSGTGALRVSAEFLSKFYPNAPIFLPNPTWGNHNKIFPNGGVKIMSYRYYNPATRGLDYDGMCADLQAAPEGSIVLLHACAHNPTGVDPTPEQWAGILAVVVARRLLALFDSAYQGFASGSLDRDAQAVRMFTQAGLELIICQSYAKNMGLYGERVGALSVVCKNEDNAKRVESQLKMVIRPMYSSPPAHGAAIAEMILGTPQFYEEWKVELKMMADRIILMRQMLHTELGKLGTPGNWRHILDQIGMFTYTGLAPKQVENMTVKHHIYMTKDGRISMAGLSSTRCSQLARAIDDSIRNY